MRLGVADGNRTRDLLHCRRTLCAKSHSNGVIDCHSEPLLVLLQVRHFICSAAQLFADNIYMSAASPSRWNGYSGKSSFSLRRNINSSYEQHPYDKSQGKKIYTSLRNVQN
jgi:hypothetical protein